MFGTVTVSALADLTFLVECVGTFMVCFHTKFQISNSYFHFYTVQELSYKGK